MAIALVGSIGQAQAATTPVTTGFDTGLANFLAGLVADYAGLSEGTLSDFYVNTWNGLTVQSNSPQARSRIHYATNVSGKVGAGHTLTYAGDVYGTISLGAFSGVHATAPFDVENGAIASGTGSIQPGSVTPSVDGCLIITGLTFNLTGGAPTINGGFSTPVTTDYNSGTAARGGSVSYLIQTTAAAVNPTWTLTAVADLAAVIAVFKPAAGGAAFVPFPRPRGMFAGAHVLSGGIN